MSSPPPNNIDPHNNQPTSSNEGSQSPQTNNEGSSSTSAPQHHSPLPSISFSIAMPGPVPPAPTEGQNPQPSGEGANQPPNEERNNGQPGSQFLWTFTIRPDDPPPAPPGESTSDEGNAQNGEGQQQRPRPTSQAPPWIFPPFLNFFMPLRTEPQPNPEKAAELLRSLPTVGRRLLMRVDRIVAAQETDVLPEEKGWKCGVCLEGLSAEEEEDTKDKGKEKEQDDSREMKIDGAEGEGAKADEKKNGTGVKALPCNHLFHEECLQPWFTTKHTCPSCRLDLDPLQTLNSPTTHTDTPRPGQTGSGRRSPHPYARNPTATSNTPSTEANATAETGNTGEAGSRRLFNPGAVPGTIPSVGLSEMGNPAEDDRPTITFIFSGSPPPGFNLPGMPPRPTTQAPSSAEPNAQPTGSLAPNSNLQGDNPEAPGQAETTTTQGGTDNTSQPAPSTPGSGSLFDVPTFFSSPLPMGSRASPSPAPDLPSLIHPIPPTLPATVPPPSSSQAEQPSSALPLSPTTIPAPPAASNASTDHTLGDRPRPERRPHITIIRRTPSPAPGGLPPPGAGLGLGNLPLPPFLFPNIPPGFLGPHPGQINNNGNNPSTDAVAPPHRQGTPTPAPAPFVLQSLESWTEEREKSLGWRCDALECIFAPPTSEDEDVEMAEDNNPDEVEGDKEMLSIYSTLQLPLTSDQEREEEKDGKFVLMACPHKWHRKCLEISERSSGRLFGGEGEDDGRIWVRCEKCRKDGWVRSKAQQKEVVACDAHGEEGGEDDEEYAPSEREVENLVNY
ncbi:hypothetical protein I302_104230 [Kwoniella bestiolae CBS 10118]|uniref:RING-type domain-containing protein n=1 Tax=Kwoniella bestiolae CBS 10118 TaxID=1296100 RepID=A0A1B9GAN5_9TREE|nr:hypothetical protein I302_02939 [Kwoniella bestiolae CBS 10118]OCF28088.1 hypothetical protein I302_02939 [Kwoniella bestiolae CBS 10118]